MSQYRGYYTSTKNDNLPSSSSSSSSLPFIVSNDDDFEYDRSYTNHNKRPYSQVDAGSYNGNPATAPDPAKHQKVSHYYSNSYSSTELSSGHTNQYQGDHGSARNHNEYESISKPSSKDRHGTREDSFPSSSFPSFPTSSTQSSPISPELAMPVFQTVDRCNQWEKVKPSAFRTACDDEITLRSEKSEQWAWGNGKKWVGASGPRPKLNVYSGAPKVEMFTSAARVTGGIGEKMLQKMGWREGEGLGKSKEGATEPIKFSEIKTDRKGLISQDDTNVNVATVATIATEVLQEKTKSKFSEIKSTSFWNWHGTGMKGPENVNARLKSCKKAAKEKIAPTLDLTGKHPVSALMELCSKKKWKEPRFITETSPAGFMFKVEVNGTLYSPTTSSDTKKSAKAESARTCLVQMGWQL